MGRGMGRKAALTKKCSCDNPVWVKEDIEVSGSTAEITYILSCKSCGANWGTKMYEARKYWTDKMDMVPIVWQGYRYEGGKTTRELFKSLDEKRLEHLTKMEKAAEKKVLEAQKEVDKAVKAVEKFNKQMEELSNL